MSIFDDYFVSKKEVKLLRESKGNPVCLETFSATKLLQYQVVKEINRGQDNITVQLTTRGEHYLEYRKEFDARENRTIWHFRITTLISLAALLISIIAAFKL